MSSFTLADISSLPDKKWDKDTLKSQTDKLINQLEELQNLLYASNKYSVLLILQGMDASGKDGLIKKVFSAINPMGCRVYSFKKPTEEEMSHEFLWRIHAKVPPKGMIHIFNRSQYEDVLIQRVRKWVDMDTIRRRYDHINAFEKLLQENNTIILKCYLHVSHDEQLERLDERKQDPRKMWKYNANDMEERKLWDDYMQAYEDVFTHCSPEIPWHIIPSDKNWYKEYMVADLLAKKLEQLNMQYPTLSE